jgi:hypothetical protein
MKSLYYGCFNTYVHVESVQKLPPPTSLFILPSSLNFPLQADMGT